MLITNAWVGNRGQFLSQQPYLTALLEKVEKKAQAVWVIAGHARLALEQQCSMCSVGHAQ